MNGMLFRSYSDTPGNIHDELPRQNKMFCIPSGPLLALELLDSPEDYSCLVYLQMISYTPVAYFSKEIRKIML